MMRIFETPFHRGLWQLGTGERRGGLSMCSSIPLKVGGGDFQYLEGLGKGAGATYRFTSFSHGDIIKSSEPGTHPQ